MGLGQISYDFQTDRQFDEKCWRGKNPSLTEECINKRNLSNSDTEEITFSSWRVSFHGFGDIENYLLQKSIQVTFYLLIS